MHRPLTLLTCAFISGLLLGHGFLYFPYSISVLVVLAVLTAGVFTRLNKLTTGRFVLVLIPGLFGMAAYLYSAAWVPADHYTHLFKADKAMHAVTGRISSPLDRDAEKTGFALEVLKIDDMPTAGRVRVSVRGELVSLGYGDTIRITGRLFEPRSFRNPGGFDYAEHLARQGILHTVSVKSEDEIEVLGRGQGIFRSIQDRRERIRRSFLASTGGAGSAVLQAMVLGEEGGLTDELRDRFMAAGVTHIISISGSHLGMMAIFCFGLIRGMMLLMPERHYHRLTLVADPKKIAAWLTLPALIFYTLLAGGQLATIRSLIMISAGLLALIMDREHALAHTLALAALIILIISPQAIFDISFQLSFISVFVISYAVMLWNDLQFKEGTRLRKMGNSVVLLVIISFSTSLATGPLVAQYFNQISFAGVLANMVVVPFAGMIVVPVGLVSGILSLMTDHLAFSGANQFIADAFVRLVTFFSRLPFAEFHPPAPGVLRLLLYALFLAALAASVRARLIARFKPLETSLRAPRGAIFVMALSGSLLLLLAVLPFLPGRSTEVCFPDVGQGDCALITFSSGKTVLIDGGGTRDNRFDMGRRVLAPSLWNRGIRTLDLVVLSHPHPDHMNGLLFILSKFKVAEVWEAGLDTDLPGHEEFRRVLIEKIIPLRIVSADDPPIVLGNAELRILHPRRAFDAPDRQAYAAENNRSLVVEVRSEGKALLFTGDIGTAAEQDIVRTVTDLKTDLLKIPHHGSKSSSSEAFVNALRPEIGVITVGKGNQYRHPSEEVVARYERAGTRICRTDSDGMVSIRIRRNGLEVVTWNDLLMNRIGLRDGDAWGSTERANGSRLLIRTTAF